MDVTSLSRPRLIVESIPLGEVDAGSFLRLHQGMARGYWADGRGWAAHAGELASLRGGDAPSQELFRDIAGQADRLGEELGAEPGDLRFYGGFRFSSSAAAGAEWEEFGPALFTVPTRELRVTSNGAHLIGRMLADVPGGHSEGVRSDFRSELEALAERVTVRSGLDRDPDAGVEVAPGAVREGRGVMRPLPSPERRDQFEAVVQAALDHIGAGTLEKVVVARALDIAVAGGADPVRLALRLREIDPQARAFLFQPSPGAAFVGAAPETLFAMAGGRFEATAVAGSAPRGATPDEDERFGRALMESGKDAEEHGIAVREIVARLSGYVGEVETDERPRLLRLARIQHLETRIRGRLGPAKDVLDIVARLHPTPAVGGVPRVEAATFLDGTEGLDRGWYAAPVGWFDGEGNGAFAPALRCALVTDGRCRLFAGAGIVRGSEPRSEWEETEVKLQSVLRALERSVPG